METTDSAAHRESWNKAKIVGQKAPFKLKDIWALRVRLQMEGRVRELALFDLGIDSKLRGCDLVALKVRDVSHGDQVATRAIVMHHKTKRPVQFEITQATRKALQAWTRQAGLKSDDFLLPSRLHGSPHLGTRQYARILGHWVDELGLDRADYGTHPIRRTKATMIYRRNKNLRAVQLLLGQSKLGPRCDTSAAKSMMPWRSPSERRFDLANDRHSPPPGRRPGGKWWLSSIPTDSRSRPGTDRRDWQLAGVQSHRGRGRGKHPLVPTTRLRWGTSDRLVGHEPIRAIAHALGGAEAHGFFALLTERLARPG